MGFRTRKKLIILFNNFLLKRFYFKFLINKNIIVNRFIKILTIITFYYNILSKSRVRFINALLISI